MKGKSEGKATSAPADVKGEGMVEYEIVAKNPREGEPNKFVNLKVRLAADADHGAFAMLLLKSKNVVEFDERIVDNGSMYGPGDVNYDEGGFPLIDEKGNPRRGGKTKSLKIRKLEVVEDPTASTPVAKIINFGDWGILEIKEEKEIYITSPKKDRTIPIHEDGTIGHNPYLYIRDRDDVEEVGQ